MSMMQLTKCSPHNLFMLPTSISSPVISSFSYSPSFPYSNRGNQLSNLLFLNCNERRNQINTSRSRRRSETGRSKTFFIASSSSSWSSWKPDATAPSPPLSDIIWPAAGAFAAMAMLGKIDQMLSPKGISMTIAPLGAVCAVLFCAPSSPAAKKYNMFMAQIGCAAFGVLAFTVFGPGWLARSVSLAASIAFMTYTGTMHPPAASLPILFIDAAKLHQLNFWYVLFPGAAGCILLALMQEVVCYLKNNFKF
ncbi:transmembrane protein DDB_G0273707/DDB_G0273361-like [Papaver somniferum]|uniref:transmembrane protein DDB_G0273707/DDB_G0273361-like n=1 Tax=Papaver somniferum TaxID=3469 RepID=UPI000E6FAA48|nr:transmembrane protein DDB_G0273707/DDB_G0273361-like [Papaver somniferum]